MNICTTNIDLHFSSASLSQVAAYWNVDEKDINEQHCLGLCFLCQQRPVAWTDEGVYLKSN